MSTNEVVLPSLPRDTSRRKPMSGLFAKSLNLNMNPSSDGFSDPLNSDSEIVARKRVDFQVHPVANQSTPESEVAPSLRSLPPSRDCQQKSRPILKQTQSLDSNVSYYGMSEREEQSVETLVKQIAYNDRQEKMAAYHSLTAFLKSSETLTLEQNEIKPQVLAMQTTIKRDLVVLDNYGQDSSEERHTLVNQSMSALKLAIALVWNETFATFISEDFRGWLVERAIHILREHTQSKQFIIHYMRLLVTQNFRSHTLTHNNRTLRLLTALDDLLEHVPGKSVTSERLHIYHKLIAQTRTQMKSKPELWMRNLLMALAHVTKEIRSSAIECCAKASQCFAGYAGSATVSAVARAALAETTNNVSLNSYLVNRMTKLLNIKDDQLQVPSTWIVVLLLCNANSMKIGSWVEFPEWLMLIQRCFNSSDSELRTQAYMAWNRLYYLARLSDIPANLLGTMLQPSMAVLSRPDRTVDGRKGTRQAAASSYSMLLYYAFRPAATHSQYTRAWNSFIVPFMRKSILEISAANCDLACRVLLALFYRDPQLNRPWNENKAHENKIIEPEDLPALDCKWIKAKMPEILLIMQVLVEYASFGPAGTVSEQSYIARAWRNLIKALKESMSKEVMSSAETKLAFLALRDFLSEDHDKSKPYLALLTSIVCSELEPTTILMHVDFDRSEKSHIVLLYQIIARHKSASEGNELINKAEIVFEQCIQLLSTEMEKLRRLTDVEHGWSSDVWAVIPQRIDVCKLIMLALPSSTHEMLVEKIDGSMLFILRSVIQQMEEEEQKLGEVSVQTRKFYTALLLCVQSFAMSRRPELRDKDINTRSWLEVLSGSSLWQDWTACSCPQLDCVAHSHQERPVNPADGNTSSTIRAHHNDSQVEFIAIDSSPAKCAELESQQLTHRQKEVRTRQRTEPVVTFPDLRSSSPNLQSDGAQACDHVLKRNATPEVKETPPSRRRDDVEADHTATPTPKARRSKISNIQPDIPSSPPSIPDDEQQDSVIRQPILGSPLKQQHNINDLMADDEMRNSEADGELEMEIQEATIEGNEKKMRNENEEGYTEAVETQVKSFQMKEVLGRDASIELPEMAMEDIESAVHTAAPQTAVSEDEHSDEIDAAAASQLVQESFSASQQRRSETPDSQASKRKRTIDSASGRRASKRHQVAKLNDEMEDCIVVNTQSWQPGPKPVPKARRVASQELSSQKSSSPAPSQSSQRSIDSPRRRRRGGKRGRKSQSQGDDESHTSDLLPDEVAETQILTQQQERLARAATPIEYIEVLESAPRARFASFEIDTGSPLLVKVPKRRGRPRKVPSDIDMVDVSQESAAEDAVQEIAQDTFAGAAHDSATEPVEETNDEALEVANVDHQTTLMSNLQNTLEQLENMQNITAPVLAEINRLLFKIGFKAQALSGAS